MLRRFFILLSAMLVLPVGTRAEISWTGDVDPEDPRTWTDSSTGYVGNTSDGTITVESGAALISERAYLGYEATASGAAVITGVDSSWDSSLYVGYAGVGQFRIEEGAVSNGVFGSIGDLPGSEGTAVVTGTGSQWNNSSNLTVGSFGGGNLRIEAGGHVSNSRATIGNTRFSTGNAVVTGANSTWTNRDRLYVGDAGIGALHVEAGGVVSNANGYISHASDSMGEATVTGDGSHWINENWLFVGYHGSGKLTVSEGGLVTANTLYGSIADLYGDGAITTNGAVLDTELRFDASTGASQNLSFGTDGAMIVTVNGGDLGAGYKSQGSILISDGVTVASTGGYLGYHEGSTGVATVTGTGSNWNTSSLFVGRDGSGRLTVESGAQVTTNVIYASLKDLYGNGTITATRGGVLDAEIAFTSSSGNSQTLTFGSGGTLALTADAFDLGAGYRGQGSIAIADGANVTSRMVDLGYHSGAEGSATVSGPESSWRHTSILTVGRAGSGSLLVEDGGMISGPISSLGRYRGSNGIATVTGSGSHWHSSTSLNVGLRDQADLYITRGGLVSARSVSIRQNFYEDYSTDPTINITTGGMLAIERASGTTIEQFFAPPSNLRTWSTDLGSWIPISEAPFEDYTLEYITTGDLAGYTVLTVGTLPNSLAGDFNNDGTVDLADYSVWRNHLGAFDEAVINHAGDGLGGVDMGDYEIWKSHFGNTAATSSNTAVPEPSAVLLALIASYSIGTVNRRFRLYWKQIGQ